MKTRAWFRYWYTNLLQNRRNYYGVFLRSRPDNRLNRPQFFKRTGACRTSPLSFFFKYVIRRLDFLIEPTSIQLEGE
jgi:hypothetical protein